MIRTLILSLLFALPAVAQDYGSGAAQVMGSPPAAGGSAILQNSLVCTATGQYAAGDCGAPGCAYIQDGVNFTVEFWGKPIGDNFDANRYSWGLDDSSEGADITASLQYGRSVLDEFRFAGDSGGWNQVVSAYDTSYADSSAWHHWAISYDVASDDCNLWMDGSSYVESTSCDFSIGATEDADQFILCDVLSATGFGTNDADIQITEVRVWDSERDPVNTWDCQLACADGVTGCPSGLQNYWPTNEASGSSITEYAGGTGAVNLTVTGATRSSDVPTFDNDGANGCAD